MPLETFLASVKAKAGGTLIQFRDRDAIAAWAGRSGLAIDSFFDVDKVNSDSRRDPAEK